MPQYAEKLFVEIGAGNGFLSLSESMPTYNWDIKKVLKWNVTANVNEDCSKLQPTIVSKTSEVLSKKSGLVS